MPRPHIAIPTLELFATIVLEIFAVEDTPTEIPAPTLFAMRLSWILPCAQSNKTTPCANPFTMRLLQISTGPDKAVTAANKRSYPKDEGKLSISSMTSSSCASSTLDLAAVILHAVSELPRRDVLKNDDSTE